jgi:hypothetical protein
MFPRRVYCNDDDPTRVHVHLDCIQKPGCRKHSDCHFQNDGTSSIFPLDTETYGGRFLCCHYQSGMCFSQPAPCECHDERIDIYRKDPDYSTRYQLACSKQSSNNGQTDRLWTGSSSCFADNLFVGGSGIADVHLSDEWLRGTDHDKQLPWFDTVNNKETVDIRFRNYVYPCCTPSKENPLVRESTSWKYYTCPRPTTDDWNNYAPITALNRAIISTHGRPLAWA